MTTKILFLLLTASAPALAATAPLTLQDGEYTAGGDQCPMLASTDVSTGTLTLEQVGTGLQSCDQQGVTYPLQRVSDTEFAQIGAEGTVDSAFLAQCAPTAATPEPCWPGIYDSSGKLIIQLGDQYAYWYPVQLNSDTSFDFLPRLIVVTRGSAIVTQWTDIQDGGATVPILFVKTN